MMRIGSLLSTAHLFFWTGAYMISTGVAIVQNFGMPYVAYSYSYTYNSAYSYYDAEEAYENFQTAKIFYFISLPFFVLSAFMYVIVFKHWRTYCSLYKNPAFASEVMNLRANIQVGTMFHFLFCFSISFFFPIVGSMLGLTLSSSLKARYGIVLGMSCSFLAIGFIAIFVWFLGFLTGNVFLLLGLFLTTSAVVYYERALMTARMMQIPIRQ